MRHISKDDWGSSVRSRIKLRKIMGREPTGEEIKALSDNKDVTEAEILEAFSQGDEVRPRTFKGGSLILRDKYHPVFEHMDLEVPGV